MTEQKRFVLQAIDAATECVMHDVAFEVGELQELCAQLQLSLSDFNPTAEYDLDKSDVDRIKNYFKLVFELISVRGSIRPWRATDALPYKIHTNRELALMLEGSKPLAAFVFKLPSDSGYAETPERFL